MNKQSKPLRILADLDLYVAEFCVVLLVVLTIAGIIVRYVFNHPFAWLEEITSWAFLWCILLGACAAFRRKSHVSIEIVYEYLPVKLQHVFDILIAVINTLLLVYLTYQGIKYVGTVAGANRVTGLLRLPYKIIYGLMPVTAALMLVNMLYAFVQDVRKWNKPDGADGKEAEA